MRRRIIHTVLCWVLHARMHTYYVILVRGRRRVGGGGGWAFAESTLEHVVQLGIGVDARLEKGVGMTEILG